MEAVSKAAVMAVSIVVSICANILVIVALLDFADETFEWFGNQAGVEGFSLRVRGLGHLSENNICEVKTDFRTQARWSSGYF